MTLDIRILEVLVSRICHDLISPIFAVSNGAELVADMGGVTSGADDAFDLIRTSAVAASIKLQAFRLAYGAGGSEWHVSMDDTEKTFADLVGLEPRYKLEWNLIGSALPQPLPRGVPKIAMLVLMWAMESLPRGGTIKIGGAAKGEGVEIVIEALGTGATLRDGVEAAFAGTLPAEELTPKTVHAAASAHYAHAYGIKVAPSAAPDHVRFVLSV